METIKLLYPNWIIVAVIVFLILLVFIGVIFFYVSIKFIHFMNEETVEPIYYIEDINGDNLINIEEIEQVSQRYNTIDEDFEIIYYLKSNNKIIEKFDTSIECQKRFKEINETLNYCY